MALSNNNCAAVIEISCNPQGHLSVKPDSNVCGTFEFIYRDASGVRWDEHNKSLVAYEPERWSAFDLYRQILSAVKNEYGCQLFTNTETRWSNVPEAIRQMIEALPNCQP